MKWSVGRLVWESRGHKMLSVSEALKGAFPGVDGFSVPNIQRLAAKTTEEIPEEVAKVILALPIEKGFEEPAELLRLGLATLARGPLVDAEALAEALRAKLPQVDPEVILRAIEALAAELRDVGGRVDGHARRGERERKEDKGELRAELRRVAWILGALIVVVGAGVVACLHPRSAAGPGDSAHARGGGAVDEVIQGGQRDPYGSLNHAIAGETGERKEQRRRGRPMPHQPLPHQAVAPCEGSAKTLYGACWLGPFLDEKAPCPPDLFQEGNACYAPIAADPNVPVGTPEKPQHGRDEPTHGAIPGKEQEQ